MIWSSVLDQNFTECNIADLHQIFTEYNSEYKIQNLRDWLKKLKKQQSYMMWSSDLDQNFTECNSK